MVDSRASNAAVWKSEESIAQWVSTADERERGRARPRQVLADLLPFSKEERFTFVDLGAGTGAAAQALLDRYPGSTAVLTDYSPQMMEAGREVLARYEERCRYLELDLEAGRWPQELAGGLELVISSLCVHHLPDARKRALFAEVFERLEPGAWYFNYDPVAAADPEVEATWQRVTDRRDPEGAERRANATGEERARWENHIRHISPLDPQLRFLRTVGFEAVDVYWKDIDHVIFGGRRPFAA